MTTSRVPRLLVGAATDIGRKRSRNQDRYRTDPQSGLFAVIDGVGGQVAGEVAAETAAQSIQTFISETELDRDKTWPYGLDPSLSDAGNRLRAALLVANHDVARRIQDDPALAGMAATGCAVLVSERGSSVRASIAHVGDCRVYRLHAGELTPQTRDHSWIAEQIERGILDANAADTHPHRHLVTRAIAGGDQLEVDVKEVPLEPGDLLLLCSDGLHGSCRDEEMQRILNESPASSDVDLEAVSQRLVDCANGHGGPDNVTLVLVRLPA